MLLDVKAIVLDWINTYNVESLAFSINFFVFNLTKSLSNFINPLFFFEIFEGQENVFLVSVFYDLFFYFNSINIDSFSIFFSSIKQSFVFSNHYELLIYLNKYISISNIDYTAPFVPAFYNSVLMYSTNFFWSNFFCFCFCFYVFFIIKLFFFSVFFSVSNNENTLDLDYAVTTTIVEVEKEIAAIDDLIIIIVALLFIFGIYFAMYGLVQLVYFVGNFCVIFFILPFFFYFIYAAPLCLLFDFGIYCFVYLRGTGPTSALIVELMYDLINLFAYYIRVCVQLARILLMLIAGGSLQEFIFYFGVYYKFFFYNESFFEDIYNFEFNYKTFTYFFVIKFSLYILYWVYEVFHTYFVVTVQTIAFFAMLFWLFFYLFTFFFSESQEKYLKKKRQVYKRIY